MSAGVRRAGGPAGVSRLLQLPFIDEALAVREWRRARRWLRNSGAPLLYALGTILLPWIVVPALYTAVSMGTGQTVLQEQPHWQFLTLALTLVGGGMATAFARVSQVWHVERTRQTLEGWLLARQSPGPVVTTTTLAGAALALTVSLPGVIVLAVTMLLLHLGMQPLLLTIGCLVLGALLAAATATMAFLATTLRQSRPPAAQAHDCFRMNTEARRTTEDHGVEGKGEAGGRTMVAAHPSPPPLWSSVVPRTSVFIRKLSTLPSQFGAYRMFTAGLMLLVLGLWLRIEAVEHGWGRPWEEHPGRLLLAAGLLTPAPALMGFANRRWWVFRVVERLDFPIRPETAALLLLVLYAAGALVLLRWSERAYRRLRADPERLARPELPDSDDAANTVEAGSTWGGFANPVWTRELRTRLRGKETPQFIFFASVALAVGGFTPLIAAAGQLGDPLETARVARDVFFWLAMTLAAMIVLITPGLTAEGIAVERTRGTLELLLTTPLKRRQILRGKLLGDLSVLALLVSPSLPLFGFCYLFHGAEGAQVLGILLVLALMALMCGVLGITASALHTRTMAAKWQAYILALLACGFFGGPLWLVNAIATATADLRSYFVATALLMLLYGVVLAHLWHHACLRLEYAESEG